MNYQRLNHGRGRERTNFDKLGTGICWLGSLIIGFLHAVVVPASSNVYRGTGLLGKFAQFAMRPGFAVTSILLTLFFAYYASRMRKLYDSNSASLVLFFGICTTLFTNGILIYALYSPAANSLGGLRG